MLSPDNKTFGCCSKIFGCSNKKIVIPNFVAVTKPFISNHLISIHIFRSATFSERLYFIKDFLNWVPHRKWRQTNRGDKRIISPLLCPKTQICMGPTLWLKDVTLGGHTLQRCWPA